MKLLTLNTHSLMEAEYERKLCIFADAVMKHKPDVIALQEIMQPIEGEKADYKHINAGSIPIKDGNHALNLARRLKGYNLVWLGFKISYNRFDEGLALLTPHKIESLDVIQLSPFNEYKNWRTRMALGIKINGEWFYSVHMGWWDDKESPFQYELNSLLKGISNKKQVWLMGDFNSKANEKDKGYDMLIRQGLFDSYNSAINKDDGITAHTGIDGWNNEDKLPVRIDYIFSRKKALIESSYTIFNGKNEGIISDHYGILVTTREEKR